MSPSISSSHLDKFTHNNTMQHNVSRICELLLFNILFFFFFFFYILFDEK